MMNETTKLLLDHMSIRSYLDKPVPREMIETIIDCAQAAPTSTHFQSYTIIEVTDPQTRKELAECGGGQRWVIQAPVVLLFCADLHRAERYFENIDPKTLGNAESYTVAVIDSAIAIQNALVAARSMGLGGVIVGGIRNEMERVSEMFKLPPLVAPLNALCLGFPSEVPGKKPRLPKEMVFKKDFYNEGDDEALMQKYNEEVSAYYDRRTGGKEKDRWTERCGRMLMTKPREHVAAFLHSIGLDTH